MNDIELALNASEEIGRLYKAGKSFSVDTPVHALSYLRGLASAFCDVLDRDLVSNRLSEKISSLDDRGLLKRSVKRNLRALQLIGNKAAHPERFDFVELNFEKLAEDALVAARALIEQIFIARHESVPDYAVAAVESSAIREMCARAMLDADIHAINQAGEYFKERAARHKHEGPLSAYRYPIAAVSDIEQAMFWYKRGASELHPNCMFRYGSYLAGQVNEDLDEVKKGQTYILGAAQADHAEALFYVAEKYLNGQGIFKQDRSVARELYQRAAEQRHPGALSQLGAIYAQGLGCEIDDSKAAEYTILAAEAGFPQAQYNLFVLFYNGIGVTKDESVAIKWLLKAKMQNYPNAIYFYAWCMRNGKIPGCSSSETLEEFKRAIGFKEVRSRAALNAAEMTEEQDSSIRALVTAVDHLRVCFSEISKDGDPHALGDRFLSSCKKIVGRLREQINLMGQDRSLQGNDVLVSTLFDAECIPFQDQNTRLSQIREMLKRYQLAPSVTIINALRREACLTVRSKAMYPQLQLPTAPQRPIKRPASQKPNELCKCGSGLKYKKCHGLNP